MTGVPAPLWLESFGGLRRTTSIVAEFVDSLEQTRTVPLSRAAKRPRLDDEESEVNSVNNRAEQEQAVRIIRSGVLFSLTDVLNRRARTGTH